LEGFEGAGATNGDASFADMVNYVNSRYPSASPGTSNNRIMVQDGWGSGKALSWGRETSTNTNYIDMAVGTQTTIYVGFAIKPKKTVSATETIIRFLDIAGGGVNNVVFRIHSGSTIQFYRNNTLIAGATAAGALHQNHWSYVEIKVVFHNSAGVIECRINGAEVINETGLDTLDSASTDIDTVRFQGANGIGFGNTDVTEQWLIDDVYIDTTTFHGPIKIEAVLPSAEGGTIDFTPSTGTDNSALVDENPKNDDTDYNSSADTASNKDLLAAGNLSVVTGNIKAVQVTNQAKLDAAGAIGLQSIVFDNVTQGTGSVVEISSTSEYTAVKHIFETNPDTATAWAVAEVDAMEMGYEID